GLLLVHARDHRSVSLTGTPVDAVIAEAGLSQSLDDIGAYIVRQRWCGGQGRRIRDVNIVDTAVLAEGDATLLFTVTRIAYADGTVREYALPLGLRRIGDPLAERAPDFMIAPGLTDDSRFLYDALGDPEYVQWLWTAVRGRRALQTAPPVQPVRRSCWCSRICTTAPRGGRSR